MKTFLFLACTLFIAFASVQLHAQHSCGNGLLIQDLAIQNPQLLQQMRADHKLFVEHALSTPGGANKTSAQSAIPVAFHFIVTSDQYSTLGGDSGIQRRVRSQLASLNKDYNGTNTDKIAIPSAFSSLYANVGIQFGIAKATNANTISGGVEVKILPIGTNPTYDYSNSCYAAKQATAVGLPAWDVSKYLNVWVVNITGGGGGTVLGITVPPIFVGSNINGHVYASEERGIVLNYRAVGVREYPAQNFFTNIDKGRTLTHEIGHYFELWHTWGDDGGLCVTNGGYDDNITDTPPQADATYCNFPKPSGSNCPTYPLYDACSPSGSGIMFMNYMDYVNDAAMMMFTKQQGIIMNGWLVAESFSLTQNPQLLGVGDVAISQDAFKVYPNPANSDVHVLLNGSAKLLGIDVVNMVGQNLSHTAANGGMNYNLRLADAPRGIYFIQCRFAEGCLTKKIVLE